MNKVAKFQKTRARYNSGKGSSKLTEYEGDSQSFDEIKKFLNGFSTTIWIHVTLYMDV